MTKLLLRWALCGIAMVAASGCASYYRVTDPTNGKVFYTESVDDKGNGAVEFKDARDNTEVTLQNSQVQKLNEKEYQEGMRMQAATTAEHAATTPPGMPTPPAAAPK